MPGALGSLALERSPGFHAFFPRASGAPMRQWVVHPPAVRSSASRARIRVGRYRREDHGGRLPVPCSGRSKTSRNSASFPTAGAGVGGLRPSVRIVLDSAGCQSYQCPSLGTCASVFPQSGVSESARSCVWFGSAGHRASMVSRRSIYRRVCLPRLGVRKQTSDRSYLGQSSEECRSRGGLDLQTAADHFCWTTLRRANGCRAASDFRWCSSIGRAPVL